jgi:hypothetical protein
MLKFIYFLYLNRNHLSLSFIVLSFYRKLKRIQKRLKTFDKQDKVFLFFFSSSISIACFTFCYLENPSLKIVDLYIVHTFFLTYFYLLAKKNSKSKLLSIDTSFFDVVSFSNVYCV